MCTAITLQTQQEETFFGRTMDFSYDIDPHLFIVPKHYQWTNCVNMTTLSNTYGFMGIGQELEGKLFLFDGVNEMGFAAAALYFAGCAKYDASSEKGIAAYDFLHYILGNCSSVEELRTLIKSISITGVQDPVTGTAAPLHWIAVDRSGACVVVEMTEKGKSVMENPMGVMTNSPEFPWHMTNLRNYMDVSPWQTEKVNWGQVEMTPFGQGGGSMPLPGGFTSPERFVRASYLKSHVPAPEHRGEAVTSCFHIMEGVSIPKGAVIAARNVYDYTKYTAFININTCEYFFRTYDDFQIGTARFFEYSFPAPRLVNLGGL
ncbi:linear amide C-N hydrolase [Lacrimispora sp.]|uniref:linear amide C-N hydrolase n=1 Tax=Lacrimispora sp. TaxID=2719234 RepID=UPI003460C8EC